MYKIVFGTDTMYVGSTTNMVKRKNAHKTNCNNENNREYTYNIYKYMRDHEWTGKFEKGGWDMILIEKFPCKDELEKSAREFHHYTELKPPLNTNVPGRTHKEYYEQNEEYYKQKNAQSNLINNAIKIECICGKVMLNTTHYRHKKTCEMCL
jgi:hypothetical protein